MRQRHWFGNRLLTADWTRHLSIKVQEEPEEAQQSQLKHQLQWYFLFFLISFVTITYLNINISRPSWKNESTVYFISFAYLSVFFTLFLCSCSYCILSYVYKTLKMHAHWCIYKLMFYINLIKYLFYISEYKAMLIQLLICHIYICIYMYKKSTDKNTVKVPDR